MWGGGGLGNMAGDELAGRSTRLTEHDGLPWGENINSPEADLASGVTATLTT